MGTLEERFKIIFIYTGYLKQKLHVKMLKFKWNILDIIVYFDQGK